MDATRAARISFALFFTLAAGTALAQRTPQWDAAGRPVVDASGRRTTYSTPAVAKPSAAAASSSAGRVVAGGARKLSIQSQSISANSSTPNYTEQWRALTWGTGIGLTGFWPVDVDGDGKLEFVTGGGKDFSQNMFWSIVGYDEARHKYRIRWQSPASATFDTLSTFTAVCVVETNGTKRVWLGTFGGVVAVKDLVTHADVTTINAGASTINDLAIADADNDGTLDVVALTDTKLFIYNAATAALERTLNYGGDRLAVGNVDGDANLEIVLNTGKVLEVTPSSTTVQLDVAAFGYELALADIDADGREELVVSEGWYHIKAWDLDVPSIKWDHPTSHDISALRLADVTGDGVPEVLYGDGQWGGLHALLSGTGDELWTLANQEHGVTDIAVFDADHDGQPELIWGSGWSDTGPDYIHVHDLTTRAQEWKSVDYIGPYQGIDVGDVDGDGQLEIVTSPVNGAYAYGGVLSIVDAVTHEPKWSGPLNPIYGAVGGLRVRDVDSDPQAEIIVAAGRLSIFDGQTHALQFDRAYDTSYLQSLAVADVDGDGKPEIVAGTRNGGAGDYLYVVNSATGDVIWRSASLPSTSWGVWNPVVADVGAPGIDILAIGDGFIYRWRWADKQLLTSTTGNYRAIAVADALGTGQRQIVAGLSTGDIEILDPDTLASLGTQHVCTDQVWAIEEHAPRQLAFTCGSSFVIYDVVLRSVVTQTETNVSWLGQWEAITSAAIAGKKAYLLGGFQAIELLDVSGNNVPSVDSGSYPVHWRGSTDFTLTASDVDGDPLSFELVGFPAKGSLTWLDRARGALRYSANGTSKGSDALSVRVFDGFQYSPAKSVALTLTNTVPTTSTTSLSFHWRGAQSARLAAYDADGDPVAFSIETPTAKVALNISDAATGTVQFVPGAAYLGSDSLTYRVSDGADTSAPQSVQVTLTNATPTAQNGSWPITAGTTVSARVSAEDTDGDPVTYEVVQQPTKGTFTIEAGTGLFQYVPASGGTGTDMVTVAVSDGVSRSQSASLEFRYPAASDSGGGGGGGGGALDWLTLALLLLALGVQQVMRRRRAPRYGCCGR